MYKKIFSAILFGAITLASTSTFVSCKDYDDDIDALNTRVDANDKDNLALHSALDQANEELKNLKQKLTDEVSRLEGLITTVQETAEENKQAIAKEILRATAAEAELEARIEKLEKEVIPELETLIKDLQDNKLDKKTFEDAVADIYPRLEAVETGLGDALKRIETLEKGLADEVKARKALAEDLDLQKKTIEKHGERLDNIENTVIPGLKDEIQKLRDQHKKDIDEINGKIDELRKDVDQNTKDIEQLKKDVIEINKKIEAINKSLSQLNVLVSQSLRSLVFIPDFYYWGIEATEFNVVNYKYWELKDMPAVSANENDPTWDKGTVVKCYDHKGHKNERQADFLVENFVARYHLNPSSADLKGLTKDDITILSADRNYRTKAASPADDKAQNIAVASFDPATDVKNGNLYLNLTIKDPEQLKKVGHLEKDAATGQSHFVQDADETKEVTVFATEVNLKNSQYKYDADKDQNYTVTSDYAAVLVNVGKDGYRLAHTAKGDEAVKGAGLTSSYTKIVNNTDDVHAVPGHEAIVCKACNLGTPKNRHLFTDADETVYGDVQRQVVTLTEQPLVSALGEAVSTTTAQDIVVWNSTINLSKLVEVHRLGDTESVVNATTMKNNGFEIRFELTGILMEENATSESAHAAIKKNDAGDYILRPQLPQMGYDSKGQYKGIAAEWEKTKQDRTTIGRTPLVRVLLVDTKHNDRVLDYGYIRLVIIDTPQEAPVVLESFRTVEYQTGNSLDYKYSDCHKPNVSPWSWTQTWASFENDLYNMYSLSQRDFENRYEAVLSGALAGRYNTPATAKDLKQYLMKISAAGDTSFVECTADQYLGNIIVRPGALIGEGTKTQVLTWEVTGEQLKQYALDGKKETTRVVKYQLISAADRSQYEDIYVILKAGDIKVTKEEDKKPTVTGKFEENKIKEYWYDENTRTAQNTLHEAHLNTPSPEDGIRTWRDSRTCPFEFLLSSDFNGNFILDETNWGKYLKSSDEVNYPIASATKDFGFVILTAEKDGFKANNKAKGFSGKVYTLSTETYAGKENWGLFATLGTKKELIAYLEYDGSGETTINNIKIVLNKDKTPGGHRTDHINSFAEDILNYKPNEPQTVEDLGKNKILDLDDNVMKVILGVKVKWAGVCPYETIVPAFQVRFLRPINVVESGYQVQDAANTTQLIPLYDLLAFSDWRLQWNPTATSTINKPRREYDLVPDGGKWIVDYYYYYNVKHILVGNGEEVIDPRSERALNNLMHTNMNGNDIKTTILSTVSNNVEFTYKPATTTTAKIGEPGYYGSIQYTNNRSTVDEFDVTVPIVVCYEWGHIYKDVTIHVVKTLENTDVKVRR